MPTCAWDSPEFQQAAKEARKHHRKRSELWQYGAPLEIAEPAAPDLISHAVTSNSMALDRVRVPATYSAAPVPFAAPSTFTS
jgi:hypothetical protein